MNSILCSNPLFVLIPRFKNSPLLTSNEDIPDQSAANPGQPESSDVLTKDEN